MSDKTDKPNIDSNADTVIGLKGSEQHHDLKNQPGEKGDADHAKKSGDGDKDADDKS